MKPGPKPTTTTLDLVYAAIQAGNRTQSEIMRATGLKKTAVGTAMTRLRDVGKIERLYGKHGAPVYVKERCLLGQLWTYRGDIT